MKKHWKDLIVSAAPFVGFLERNSYFDSAFSGDQTNKLILTDAKVAHHSASDDTFSLFDEWESVSESPGLFPADFEWSSWIDHNLVKNGFFGINAKNFSGADSKWTFNGICLLQELLCRDMKILLNCYSNEYFSPLWEEILAVYLNNGLPCGWHGRYPEGKLVVFSNC